MFDPDVMLDAQTDKPGTAVPTPLASKDDPDLKYPCPDGFDPALWALQDIGFRKNYYTVVLKRTGE